MKHWLFLAIVPYWLFNANAKLPPGCKCEEYKTGYYRPVISACPALYVRCVDPRNPPAGTYKPAD